MFFLKERISLTIDEDLIRKIDLKIDGDKFRSRSHVIEFLLKKALGLKKLKKAFILAGGKGTRLRPITYEVPKPMMPVKGKPILQYHIEQLRKYGIIDIIISIGYLGNKIKEYFGDGTRFGVKITYVEESEPLGTGGALGNAKHLLNEVFVMINGDNLIDIDLDEMYEAHKKSGKLVTMALTAVENPSSYGVVILKGDKIINFVEKPKNPTSNLINAGVYIIEPEVLEIIPNKPCSIERDVFPKIVEQEKMTGYVFAGQWLSTDSQEKYEKAIKEWKGISN